MEHQLDARERLRAWVEQQGRHSSAAAKIGCHRTYLVHLLGSVKRRPGLTVAFKIERATDGQIRAVEWSELDPTAVGTGG